MFMPGNNKYDHLQAIILERGGLLNNLVTVKTRAGKKGIRLIY
jgi:hypothetical protein